jgi:hypothetical protein
MSKSLILFTALATAGVLAGVPASASSAAAPIDNLSITQVGYNANGSDTWWNRNKEYVEITATADVNVKNLVVADSWAKSNAGDNAEKCNTYTVTALPGVEEVGGVVPLPANDKIRVYSGSGTNAKVGGTFRLFMNSKCGYRGHYLNNGGDTVWLSQGGGEEWFSYNFDNGYYVKP